MRSVGRAASTKRRALLRTRSSFSEVEPERSIKSTRSKGVEAVAKNSICCGSPSSKTAKSCCCNSPTMTLVLRLKTVALRSTSPVSMLIRSTGSAVCAQTEGKWRKAKVKRQKAKVKKEARDRRLETGRKPLTSLQSLVFSLSFCLLPFAFLLCIVSTFAARDGVGACDRDTDGTPATVPRLVRRAIREAVDGAEVCDDALVCARQVFQFFHFVKDAAALVCHLFH